MKYSIYHQRKNGDCPCLWAGQANSAAHAIQRAICFKLHPQQIDGCKLRTEFEELGTIKVYYQPELNVLLVTRDGEVGIIPPLAAPKGEVIQDEL